MRSVPDAAQLGPLPGAVDRGEHRETRARAREPAGERQDREPVLVERRQRQRSKPKSPSTTWRTTHEPVVRVHLVDGRAAGLVESRLVLRCASTEPSSAIRLSNRLSILRSGKPGLERTVKTIRGRAPPVDLHEALVLHLERREAEEQIAGGVAQRLARRERGATGPGAGSGGRSGTSRADLLLARSAFRRGERLLERGAAFRLSLPRVAALAEPAEHVAARVQLTRLEPRVARRVSAAQGAPRRRRATATRGTGPARGPRPRAGLRPPGRPRPRSAGAARPTGSRGCRHRSAQQGRASPRARARPPPPGPGRASAARASTRARGRQSRRARAPRPPASPA